jgi:hypothetical protein
MHCPHRVLALNTNYYIISRRYICTSCETKHKQAKDQAEELAQAAGVQLAEEEEGREASPPPYTFMGYDMRSLPGLARSRGAHFPAVLTKNAGLDKTVVDLLRPLLDGGVRPARVSKLLLELHTKEHTRAAIAHEEETADRREAEPAYEAAPLSPFADKERWAGLVPGPKYLCAVYKRYSTNIAPFLDAEVP